MAPTAAAQSEALEPEEAGRLSAHLLLGERALAGEALVDGVHVAAPGVEGLGAVVALCVGESLRVKDVHLGVVEAALQNEKEAPSSRR